MARYGPVSTAISPTDRLSLLPKEPPISVPGADSTHSALYWAYRHRPHGDWLSQYYNETVSEIIYELIGIHRCPKNVSSHIQTFKQWFHDIKPESEHLLTSVCESISAVQNLDPANKIEEITETITCIQSKLPKLQSAKSTMQPYPYHLDQPH